MPLKAPLPACFHANDRGMWKAQQSDSAVRLNAYEHFHRTSQRYTPGVAACAPACAGAEEEPAPLRPASPAGMLLWRSCPLGAPAAAAGAPPVISRAAVGGAACASGGAKSGSAANVFGAALMSDMRPSSSMILTSFSFAWTGQLPQHDAQLRPSPPASCMLPYHLMITLHMPGAWYILCCSTSTQPSAASMYTRLGEVV